MSTFYLSVSATRFLFSTTLGMMKASGDKQCTRRTESLNKHSAVGRRWREAVRSGGEGTNMPRMGILINFMSTRVEFFIDFKARGKMCWILKATGYSNAGWEGFYCSFVCGFDNKFSFLCVFLEISCVILLSIWFVSLVTVNISRFSSFSDLLNLAQAKNI